MLYFLIDCMLLSRPLVVNKASGVNAIPTYSGDFSVHCDKKVVESIRRMFECKYTLGFVRESCICELGMKVVHDKHSWILSRGLCILVSNYGQTEKLM